MGAKKLAKYPSKKEKDIKCMAKMNANTQPWWFELLHQGILAPWTLLAACSANRAKMAQSFVRNHGVGSEGPVDLRDSDATRKWLTHKVAQFPDALVDHWVLIQRELYQDLLVGKYKFARNLAEKRKRFQDAVHSARDALTTGDKKQFNDSLDEIFSENPGGYSNKVERFVVEHWTVRPEPDLPPFCCWKDEALSDYLAERAGNPRGWGAKFMEERRIALGLLKVPAYVVVEWKRGPAGERGRPGFNLKLRDHPDVDLGAFRWICGKLNFEVFRDAFRSDAAMLQYGRLFLGFPITEKLKEDIANRIRSIRTRLEPRIRLPIKADSPAPKSGS